MTSDLDIFVGNTTLIDEEVYQLWLDGHSGAPPPRGAPPDPGVSPLPGRLGPLDTRGGGGADPKVTCRAALLVGGPRPPVSPGGRVPWCPPVPP